MSRGIVNPARLAVLLLAATLAVCLGCEDRGPVSTKTTGSADKPAAGVIAASFYPVAYFAERIVGQSDGGVSVVCPCPTGEDPADWKPSREALDIFQRSSLVVLNGAGFERWVGSASLPDSRVVESAAGLKDRFLSLPSVTHNHGPGGHHTHAGLDGHTWMDPLNAIVQAEAIRGSMSRTWLKDATQFDRGMESLRVQLLGLDARLRALTASAKAAVLLASHPAYGYIASRHGWMIVNLDVSPDEEPSAAQWAAVSKAIEGVKSDAPRVMLFEEVPADGTRARLRAEFKIETVVFDPCEKHGSGDYVERMNGNLDRLAAALGYEKPLP